MVKGKRLCGVLELRIPIQSAKDSLVKMTIEPRYHIRLPQLEERPTMDSKNITKKPGDHTERRFFITTNFDERTSCLHSILATSPVLFAIDFWTSLSLCPLLWLTPRWSRFFRAVCCSAVHYQLFFCFFLFCFTSPSCFQKCKAALPPLW